jgi:hypothetical protein
VTPAGGPGPRAAGESERAGGPSPPAAVEHWQCSLSLSLRLADRDGRPVTVTVEAAASRLLT